MALEQLLRQRADIWRGDTLSPAVPPGVPSGFAALDAELPGGGWPPGALSEILSDDPGAFALALPALARLSREGRWLLLAAPPHIPYAPALAERGLDLRRLLCIPGWEGGGRRAPQSDRQVQILWAAEQGLRSGGCAAVLAWAEPREPAALRRLQLAAEAGQAVALLFRGEAAGERPSPAVLRLRVRAAAGGLEVWILKRHGGLAVRHVALAL